MPWEYLAISIVGSLAVAVLLCIWLIRLMRRREPYASFLRLGNRRKLSFFRLLIQDARVPIYLKLLLLAVVIYFVSPVDFIPGFVLDDVAFALLALVIIVKYLPRPVLQSLLEEAAETGAVGRTGSG